MSAILFSILPKIIHAVAYAQGAKNVRSLQTRTIHWYLAFLVAAQLFMFPSLSTIFSLITDKADKKYGQARGLMKLWVGFIYFLTQIPKTYQLQAKCVNVAPDFDRYRLMSVFDITSAATGSIGSPYDGSWQCSSWHKVLSCSNSSCLESIAT